MKYMAVFHKEFYEQTEDLIACFLNIKMRFVLTFVLKEGERIFVRSLIFQNSFNHCLNSVQLQFILGLIRQSFKD